MSDKLSERAEQLADAIGVSTWGIPRNRAIEKILSFAADSANLARGLAIEQAAQICDEQVRLSQAIEDGDEALPHANGHSLELDEYKNRLIGVTAKNLAIEIRSLDPDAAQALAERIRQERLEQMDVDRNYENMRIVSLAEIIEKGGNCCDAPENEKFHELVRMKAALLKRDAEIERRAREDERKMCAFHDYDERCTCFHCQRIAALAESQPAPAKEDSMSKRFSEARIKRIAKEVADLWDNHCECPSKDFNREALLEHVITNALLDEVPAPAREPQECEYCDSDEWKPRHFDKTFRKWWHAKRKDSDITMPCQIGWGEPQPQTPEEKL